MNKLWGGLDFLRSSIPSSDYITVITSTALVQFHNSNTIQTLLQSGNNTPSGFYAATQEAADALHLRLPTLLASLNRALKLMTNPAFQNFQFYTLEIFKNLTPSGFLEGYFHYMENSIGKIGGEHLTPFGVNELALKILEIQKEESFLDPTCGYGNSIASILIKNSDQEIFGQDINPFASEIAQVRTILLGARRTIIETEDVLTYPKYAKGDKLQKFDAVYSDTLLGGNNLSEHFYENDPYNRFMYGSPPKSRADWAFISNGTSSLKDDGRAIYITSLGVLYRGGKEKRIRERFLELDLIEAIIKLSPGLLPNTAIPTALLLINKNKRDTRKNKVIFINAENIFSKGRQKTLSKIDIDNILELLNNENDIPGKSKIVAKEAIEDGSLTVERYVKEDQIIFDQIMGDVIIYADKLNNLDMIEVQDIATITRGVNLPSKQGTSTGIYNVIKISDVIGGEIDFKKLDRSDVAENTKIENYLIQKGDLLISTRGENIKTAVIKEDVTNTLLSQNLVSIRVKNTIDVDWLKFYLDSPVGQAQLKLELKGETVLRLPITAIQNLKIPLIDKQLQTEIVQSYNNKKSRIEKEIRQLEKQLSEFKKYSLQKMGLEETFELIERK